MVDSLEKALEEPKGSTLGDALPEAERLIRQGLKNLGWFNPRDESHRSMLRLEVANISKSFRKGMEEL